MAVTTNGDRPRYPSIAGWYTRSAEATELTYWDRQDLEGGWT